MRYKYPRTPHLPGSPGFTEDDVHSNVANLYGKEVVITEKMDGENTTLYRDGSHARSIDSRSHTSRDWLKNWWGQNSYKLHEDLRICGENLFAKHSIEYKDLKSYFLAFSIWDGRHCLGWDDTVMLCEAMGIETVKVLWRGEFTTATVDHVLKGLDLEKTEGIVVRLSDDFYDFGSSVAKWVRKNHVQTEDHWMHREVVPNTLA